MGVAKQLYTGSTKAYPYTRSSLVYMDNGRQLEKEMSTIYDSHFFEMENRRFITSTNGTQLNVSGRALRCADVTLSKSNLDTGSAFVFGSDYCIYMCPQAKNKTPIFKISLDTTAPQGYNTYTAFKIGGFHYGRYRTGTAADSTAEGIVPNSVWTYLFRPICNPASMVYIGGQTWADIYIASKDSNGYLQSKYNCTPAVSMNWFDFNEAFHAVDKRLPTSAEWMAAAAGSPNGLDGSNVNAWTATSNTTSHATGTINNATSNYGCRDCVGNVWEWIDELIENSSGSYNWYTPSYSSNYGQWYTTSATGIHALTGGGGWFHNRVYNRCFYSGTTCWGPFNDLGARGFASSL